MVAAEIAGIAYYLPNEVLTNDDLHGMFPEWAVERISQKTGIEARHIAAKDEFSSDLAYHAAIALFRGYGISPAAIDFVLFCSQTPDFALPTTACLLQDRLGLSRGTGALDFNLGCSGFVYGLGLAKALVETGQASNVLLLTAETYSKLLDDNDKSVRTIFGDAGAATLVRAVQAAETSIGPFVYGSDGSGGPNLICHKNSFREPDNSTSLRMNGPEIFDFTLTAVPNCISELLEKAGVSLADIDLFVFHQANSYMLEHLRKKVGIPANRFVIDMRDIGNTVSCTIPIALARAAERRQLQPGMVVMLVGFGVGYSWGATLVRWA